MPKHKSARHHWWPECVSGHWRDGEGCVHWLAPSGEVKRIPTHQLGAIGNGHLIKLGSPDEVETPWDETFEPEFDRADSAFPGVIACLEGLSRHIPPSDTPPRQRFLSQPHDAELLTLLAECVVSLAVRSPRNRAVAVSLAEHLRGPLPARERNALIGLNMRRTQRQAADAVGDRAKFVVVFSPDREFIYGDGFFNNLRSPLNGMFLPQMFAPLTPRMAVLIVRPTSYRPEPKLMTVVVNAAETDAFNEAVQVYAKDAIFYRADRPSLSEHFRAGEHLVYNGPNVVEQFIHSVPGVPPRNPLMDELRAAIPRRTTGG